MSPSNFILCKHHLIRGNVNKAHSLWFKQDLRLSGVMNSNAPDIYAFACPLSMCTLLSFQIRETIKPVHYCKIIDKAKNVREGNLICPDFTTEATEVCFTGIINGMCTKYLFSTQFVGEKPRLMFIIAGSPENRSLHQLRYHIETIVQRQRVGGNPKILMYTSSLHHWGTTGTCVFIFDFGC